MNENFIIAIFFIVKYHMYRFLSYLVGSQGRRQTIARNHSTITHLLYHLGYAIISLPSIRDA
jgi:hypothetical protein